MLKWFKNTYTRLGISLVLCAVLPACVSQKSYIGSDKPFIEKKSTPIEAAKNRIALGLTYLQKGNAAQAKFNLDKALEFAPDMAEAHYSMAYYYQVVKETEKAEKAYQKVIELDSNNGDAFNNYGAFLCDQGKVTKAREMFLQALEIDSYIRVAQTYENLGLCLYDTGDTSLYPDVIDYLDSALGYNPRLNKSLNVLLDIYQQQENWQKALETFQQLEAYTTATAELYLKGYQIAKKLDKKRVANEYARRILTQYSSSPQANQIRQALLQ
ncbi:type IV pilus biogenesis/stability protein PilW [Catenovulum sediminis]|uniref:Type IV pilus biogenesis/stability protein PilW n=1 Tax=Catenovulum sediminis TaxID=1740262 RepID=A0ABV1RLZ2_9ALTE|nr:type IV pilus biogenesis/stability protein PilW [Catenovulum sediminis]